MTLLQDIHELLQSFEDEDKTKDGRPGNVCSCTDRQTCLTLAVPNDIICKWGQLSPHWQTSLVQWVSRQCVAVFTTATHCHPGLRKYIYKKKMLTQSIKINTRNRQFKTIFNRRSEHTYGKINISIFIRLLNTLLDECDLFILLQYKK